MSERVQRVFYQNVLEGDAVTLTPSTEMSGQPALNLKDRSRGQVWRSALCWEVVASRNDRLDFTEAGVARVASLTVASTFATGALYAAHVQAAMNAAPGVVNTYTVTYSGATKKFTITRATGAAAVVLKWATGAFAPRSCGVDLGFVTTADDSGATSYTGDKVAYQSRHWLDIDLGAASCDIEIVLDVNDRLDFSEGATPFVAQIAAGRYRTPLSLTDAIALAMNSVVGIANTYSALWPVGTLGEFRYQISRATGAAAFSIQWASGPNNHRSIGPTIGFDAVNDTGANFYNGDQSRDGWKRVTVGLLSDHNARTKTYYVVLESPLRFAQTVGDGNPPERFTVQWNLREDMP